MMLKPLAALGAAIFLAGCTMAPDYIRPEAPVPGNWPAAAMTETGQAGALAAIDTGWRTFFRDPHLQKLIDLALKNNRDLRVASLNIERARGQYQIQRADLMPGVNASGQSSNQGVPAGLSSRGVDMVNRQNTVSVGITSFELDFFGRIQSLKDSALETYFATEEARKTAQVSLVSEVASAYLALVTDRELLAISSETLASQQASYEMIRRRYAVGVSSELDLRQAQTSVDTARVNIARYTGQVAQDMTALSLLLGVQVTEEMVPARTMAELAAWGALPVGMPSSVLLQRPDILQAEHRLKAANANIGAARAAFFPRISLTATFGTGSPELSKLFDGGTGMWSFIPQISLPLFQGGKNMANLSVSETDKAIAIANYEKAIQTAFREISNALINRKSLADQLIAQESLTKATSEAYRLSRERYNRGIDSYLTVLDSQRSMYSSQLNLISVRANRELNSITLYRTLGGGWKE